MSLSSQDWVSQFGRLLNGRSWLRGLANSESKGALDDCNRAIKRDGRLQPYLESRGLIYFRMNDPASAITDFSAALKLVPNSAWALYLRGSARIALGQSVAGKADQAAAVIRQPDIAKEAAVYGL